MKKINESLYFNTYKNIKPIESLKSQIILLNTSVPINDYFTGLKLRYNGKYNRIPTYTISLSGEIFNHFNPKYSSNIFNDTIIDRQAITIALENVGWLTHNESENIYYDWKLSQYNGDIVEKQWRGKKYWATYSDNQFLGLIELLDYLCIEYSINKSFSGNNVMIHKPKIFNGILTRSNFSKDYYDLTPAMDFDKLNNLINN